jgi:hypothetical protein
VETGAQEVRKALKALDSGFHRNDRKKFQPIFSQLPGGEGMGAGRNKGRKFLTKTGSILR